MFFINPKIKNLLIYALSAALIISFSGCAGKKTAVKKRRKVSVDYKVDMDPVITIRSQRSIKKVFVGNFSNASHYRAADVVFTDALRFKLQERGFSLVDKEEEADLIMEGKIKRTIFKRKRGGFFKATMAYLASGPAARRFIAEIAVDFNLFAGVKKYNTDIASRVITPESEIALAINEASIRLVDRLIRQIK